VKCPHCLENFHAHFNEQDVSAHTGARLVSADRNGSWHYRATQCPACERLVIFRVVRDPNNNPLAQIQVWPKGIARASLPPEVPEKFAADYREACNVLAESPKASAALSRRCLQALLRDKGGATSRDLAPAIDEVLASNALPSHLADAIDAIRNIGVFAVHPLKSTNTGEILDVEPGEAEWLLDTLEGLFDFYFIQPAILTKKRDTLNLKLAEVGKPPMK